MRPPPRARYCCQYQFRHYIIIVGGISVIIIINTSRCTRRWAKSTRESLPWRWQWERSPSTRTSSTCPTPSRSTTWSPFLTSPPAPWRTGGWSPTGISTSVLPKLVWHYPFSVRILFPYELKSLNTVLKLHTGSAYIFLR